MKDKTVTFHELYKRYANDVYRFAYWLCGDKDEAKDITSETFVRLWTANKKTRLLLKMRSYLMGFAIFCSLVPFSFFYTDGTFYWLFREAPISALIYAILGVAFWVGYMILKRKSGDL